jgi:hypothetical protein
MTHQKFNLITALDNLLSKFDGQTTDDAITEILASFDQSIPEAKP